MPASSHDKPGHSQRFSRITLYLTLAYAFLLVYGTLFPFNGWLTLDESAWSLMLQRGPSNTSRADILTNLLVYMPLGLLLILSLGNRFSTVKNILLVTLCSALLSLALEYLQTRLPGRVPSVLDLILNTLGGLAGGLIALSLQPDTTVGGKLYRLRSTYIHSTPLANLGLLTLGLWALSQLSPLVPSIDLGNLRQGLKPLWHTLQNPATLEWIRVVEYSLSITAAGMITSTLLRNRYNALFIFCAFVTLVLLLKIPVLDRQISLEALIGLVTGAGVTLLFYDRQLRIRLLIAAIAIPGMLLASGVHIAADAFTSDLAPFNWIPFRSHLANNITGLIDILGGLWPFVALNYIARQANSKHRSILIVSGSLVIFLLMFSLEWYQQYLPGRSADITDAVIATLAWLLPWYYPVSSKQDTAEISSPVTKQKSTDRRLPGYVLPVVTVVVLAVIAVIIWKPDGTPHEQPLDESTLPLLPAPEDLPSVALPDFNYDHPRLPAADADDLARLKLENPGYLRKHKKRAANGNGDLHSAIVMAYLEPGSLDLEILYQRLMALEIKWRGHQQAKPLAVAYDWLYPQWTDEQRAALQDKLASNANYLIHRIREEQRLSPYNVYLYNSPFQALMATNLALYGDHPRSKQIMNYTHDYWKNRVLPVWRQIMGRNGGWHEGGEYVGIGIGQAIYQVPAMWRSATGEDLFHDEPGIRGFLDFLVYRVRPDGTHFRWGDGGFFDRKVPDRIPLAIEYRHAAAYSLGGCRRQLVPTSWPWGPLTDKNLCDSEALLQLPLARHFDGIGMIIARSDWTPQSTYVSFKAGNNYWSHNHLDQGAFTIYKGGALAIDSGAYGGGRGYGSDHHLNYSYQSIAHNTITVSDPDDTMPAPARKDEPPRTIANDGGQRRIGSGWGVEAAPLDLEEWLNNSEIYQTGNIESYLAQDGLVVAVSDITPAYTHRLSGKGTFSHRTQRVERLWRTFGYDAVDDVIVVFDQVRSLQAKFPKRWLLHTIEKPELTADGFSVTSKADNRTGHAGGRLDGHILLPRSPQVKIVGGKQAAFLVDGTNYNEEGRTESYLKKRRKTESGSWRIELSPSKDNEDTLFMVVMLPSSLTSQPKHKIRLLEDGERVGCEITGPERITRWWFTPGRMGLDIEILTPGKKNIRHAVWPG